VTRLENRDVKNKRRLTKMEQDDKKRKDRKSEIFRRVLEQKDI
jgi:hypothetical protein